MGFVNVACKSRKHMIKTCRSEKSNTWSFKVALSRLLCASLSSLSLRVRSRNSSLDSAAFPRPFPPRLTCVVKIPIFKNCRMGILVSMAFHPLQVRKKSVHLCKMPWCGGYVQYPVESYAAKSRTRFVVASIVQTFMQVPFSLNHASHRKSQTCLDEANAQRCTLPVGCSTPKAFNPTCPFFFLKNKEVLNQSLDLSFSPP